MPGDDLDLGEDLPPVQDEKESAPAPKLPASAPMNLAEEVELDEEDDEGFDSNAPVKERSVGESTDPMITTPVPEEQLREDVRGPSDEQMESFSEFRAFEESLQNDLGEPEEHVKEEKSSAASFL